MAQELKPAIQTLAKRAHFRAWGRRALLLMLAISCLVAPFLGLMWPRYNWDMLAYIGIVKSWQFPDPVAMHAATYADAAAFAEVWGMQKPYAELIDRSDPYRYAMFSNAQSFLNQQPFYAIRPLYLATVKTASLLTGYVSAATILVSVVSVLAINAVLAVFALRRLGLAAGTAIAGTTCLTPAIVDIARLSTPDSIATLLLLLGSVALLSGREVLGACVLFFGVAVRSELQLMNLILAIGIAIISYKPLQPSSGFSSQRIAVIGILLASIVLAQVIEYRAGNYGYVVLYHFTFISGLTENPAQYIGMPISLRNFLGASIWGVVAAIENGGLYPILLCMALITMAWQRVRPAPMEIALGFALIAALAARMILFPNSDVRFFASPLVGLVAVLIVGGARSFVGPAPVLPHRRLRHKSHMIGKEQNSLVGPAFEPTPIQAKSRVIVWFLDSYVPITLAGSEITVHAVNRYLLSRGWKIHVVVRNYAPFKNLSDSEGIHIVSMKAHAEVEDLMRSTNLIFTQYDLTEAAIKTASKAQRPILVFLHGIEDVKELARIVPLAEPAFIAFVSNSEHMKRDFESLGCIVHKLHPPVDWRDYCIRRETTTASYVTLINLNGNKGGDLIHKLAIRMPDTNFLGVKGAYLHQMVHASPPLNLKYMEMTGDIRTVYERTYILIMPSEYESWGRTAVEAMASGIPVIASPTPGLKESIGDAGIFVDRNDIDGWIQAIQRLRTDSLLYQELSARASKRARELDPRPELEAFENWIDALRSGNN